MDTQPDTVMYARTNAGAADFSPEERSLLERVNQRIAAGQTLAEVLEFLFEATREICPCDRIGMAFADDDGRRLTTYWNKALYAPLRLVKGYAEDLAQSSLKRVIEEGRVRVIGDLTAYLRHHPESRSTRLLVEEGVRSNLTCPLTVDGRVVGVLFRSARVPNAYTEAHIRWHAAVLERLGQAVEKVYRIEQLTEANRAYLEMLAFVSHELKGPLATLVMSGETLLGGYLGDLPEAHRKAIERMARQGRHLTDLVREYLDLARVEGGDLKPDIQPGVAVKADLVIPAVEPLEPLIQGRGMTVDGTGVPDDLTAACDAGLMRIVFSNLAGNAVKYGRDKGAIRITAGHTKAGCRVAVWNEGPGFRDSDRGRLFRRFSRLDVPDFKGIRGTGLGLYNASRIVRAHGGNLSADSKYGEWAEFRVEWPG
jgi:hypothetical protein